MHPKHTRNVRKSKILRAVGGLEILRVFGGSKILRAVGAGYCRPGNSTYDWRCIWLTALDM